MSYNMEDNIEHQLDELDGEYIILSKNKNDILNEIDFENEEERLLCDDIINNLEKSIAEAVISMKTANIPFIGSIRINPVKRKFRNAKLSLSSVRKSLNKEQYKEHVRSIITDLNNKQHEEDRQKLVLKRIRSNNKKTYETIFKKCGRNYAELYIMSIYWLKEVRFDAEWEEHYQTLKD